MSTEFAQTYSLALYEVAKEMQDDRIKEELDQVGEAFQNPDLRQFLFYPRLAKQVKKQTLDQIFGQTLPPYLMNFLYVLIDRNRISKIDLILEAFKDLWYQRQNIDRIQVISALDLPQEKLDQIARAYERGDDRRVEVVNIVDPSIIGGLILRVDDRLIDASIRGQLDQLEKKLQQTR